jgi:hypothetical protein
MTGSAVATGRFIYLLKGGGLGEVMVSGFPLYGGWRMTGSANRLNESRDGRCLLNQKKTSDSSPKKNIC